MTALNSNKGFVRRWIFLATSGLDRYSFEIDYNTERQDILEIIYRNPITNERMLTTDGRIFKRYVCFKENRIKWDYRTCKSGGIHLYFPKDNSGTNIIKFLKTHPDIPIYITEGEKKAAKAWSYRIPCIAISGIWCWLSDKENREDGGKKLHPDFDLIPELDKRSVIMVYDSDANNPEKKDEFDRCSEGFRKCLLEKGVTRYEKIVLPKKGNKKVGLDDYLLKHPVADFLKLVAEQSKTVPFGPYIMNSKRFLSVNFPPINFVLQPWLTDCSLTLLHARPGVGKTFFLMGMSAAITRKNIPEEFCGWKIKNGAGVLYVDGEMSAKIMQERLTKIEAVYPNNSVSMKYSLELLSCSHYSRQTGKRIDFSKEDCRKEFSKYIANHPAKIIILDNIVSLISMKDENDAGTWSVINQWLLYLRSMGKSIIIVHHSGKANTQRGTSHRTDNLDTVIHLTKKGENEFKVEFEKHRNFGGAEALSVHINLNIDDNKAVFTRKEDGDIKQKERDQEMLKMKDRKIPQKDIAKKFGLSASRTSQILKELKNRRNGTI